MERATVDAYELNTALPMKLVEVRRSLEVGKQMQIRVVVDRQLLARLECVVVGAGFSVDSCNMVDERRADVRATRLRSLADVVDVDMRMLLVGLNPSPYAADTGIPFGRNGNRFWPAALRAEIVRVDRDPVDALIHHRVGFSDLVKRTTARADELSSAEYRAGAARLKALVDWLTPTVVVFVGLSGYRSAIDRRAIVGWQANPFGDAATYVMPNPSGINAHTNVEDLAMHFQSVARFASSVASASR